MNDLQSYICRAETQEKKTILTHQWKSAVEDKIIICECGQIRALELSYRCLYCGQWYCFSCAEKHFGQTMLAWVEQKRKAIVNNLEMMTEQQIKDRIRKRNEYYRP